MRLELCASSRGLCSGPLARLGLHFSFIRRRKIRVLWRGRITACIFQGPSPPARHWRPASAARDSSPCVEGSAFGANEGGEPAPGFDPGLERHGLSSPTPSVDWTPTSELSPMAFLVGVRLAEGATDTPTLTRQI